MKTTYVIWCVRAFFSAIMPNRRLNQAKKIQTGKRKADTSSSPPTKARKSVLHLNGNSQWFVYVSEQCYVDSRLLDVNCYFTALLILIMNIYERPTSKPCTATTVCTECCCMGDLAMRLTAPENFDGDATTDRLDNTWKVQVDLFDLTCRSSCTGDLSPAGCNPPSTSLTRWPLFKFWSRSNIRLPSWQSRVFHGSALPCLGLLTRVRTIPNQPPNIQ